MGAIRLSELKLSPEWQYALSDYLGVEVKIAPSLKGNYSYSDFGKYFIALDAEAKEDYQLGSLYHELGHYFEGTGYIMKTPQMIDYMGKIKKDGLPDKLTEVTTHFAINVIEDIRLEITIGENFEGIRRIQTELATEIADKISVSPNSSPSAIARVKGSALILSSMLGRIIEPQGIKYSEQQINDIKEIIKKATEIHNVMFTKDTVEKKYQDSGYHSLFLKTMDFLFGEKDKLLSEEDNPLSKDFEGDKQDGEGGEDGNLGGGEGDEDGEGEEESLNTEKGESDKDEGESDSEEEEDWPEENKEMHRKIKLKYTDAYDKNDIQDKLGVGNNICQTDAQGMLERNDIMSSEDSEAGLGEAIKRVIKFAAQNEVMRFPELDRGLKLIKTAEGKNRANSGRFSPMRYVKTIRSPDRVFSNKKIGGIENSKWLFVIDSSGSMNESWLHSSKMYLARMVIKYFGRVLPPNVKVETLYFQSKIIEGNKYNARGLLNVFKRESVVPDGGTVWANDLISRIYEYKKKGYQVVIITDGEIQLYFSQLDEAKTKFVFGDSPRPILLILARNVSEGVAQVDRNLSKFDFKLGVHYGIILPDLKENGVFSHMRWALKEF